MSSTKPEADIISVHASPSQSERSSARDEALVFLDAHSEEAISDEASLRAIRRKVDWRIPPALACCYLVQNLDKFALNYAAVMGLPKDLRLHGNDFTNVATAFFVAYIIAEIPNIYLLQRIPAAKWLALNIILWGIATACTAATTNFTTLLISRIFLGIFEATTLPSSNTIASQWYTKSEAAPRYAYWFVGNAAAQTLGGFISFGFQHMTNGALSGWRTMFLVFGILTVFVGIFVALFVPDTPMQCAFLSETEKVSLLKHISTNQTGIRNQKFKNSEIWEAIRDPQVWLFSIATICFSSSSGIVTTYSSTLIRNMGYSPKSAALLNTPSGAISLISVLAAGYLTRVTPKHHRWLWISIPALIAALGSALISFLPPTSPKSAFLIGIWLINAITACLPMLYHYVSVNVAGHTKRSFVNNLVAVSFGIGNVIGPQSFQAKDAPGYLPAKIVALVTQGSTAVLMGGLVLWYVWENGRRRKSFGDGDGGMGEREGGNEAWSGLTDRENREWRYVY
ncbi:putative MFS transporter [Dendryphion nanum]|uniref:MFS transporter n=1 Tax=Dendryphion nanum TaxID=256645 RepID=A0A9P9DPY3_9PLEO|nr:putative MFS transporter [Dendryphion nanum]